MVVNVYVEGGIVNGNVDATTNNNSEALREELNRFMQRALNRNAHVSPLQLFTDPLQPFSFRRYSFGSLPSYGM